MHPRQWHCLWLHPQRACSAPAEAPDHHRRRCCQGDALRSCMPVGGLALSHRRCRWVAALAARPATSSIVAPAVEAPRHGPLRCHELGPPGLSGKRTTGAECGNGLLPHQPPHCNADQRRRRQHYLLARFRDRSGAPPLPLAWAAVAGRRRVAPRSADSLRSQSSCGAWCRIAGRCRGGTFPHVARWSCSGNPQAAASPSRWRRPKPRQLTSWRRCKRHAACCRSWTQSLRLSRRTPQSLSKQTRRCAPCCGRWAGRRRASTRSLEASDGT